MTGALAQRFRSRPTTITAFRWTGQAFNDFPAWFQDHLVDNLAIVLPNGHLAVCPAGSPFQKIPVPMGSWVIREPDNSGSYPCEPDIFEARYEPVAE